MKKIFLFLFAMFFIINQATAQSYSAEDLFNDIANVTTIGYKAIDLDNVKKLSRCIHTKGVLTGTGKPFDFAIFGQNGFFKVQEPKTKKIYYTRNGRFSVSENGTLVLENGYELIPTIKINKKMIIKKTEIKGAELFIEYADGFIQKSAIQIYGFDAISNAKEGVYFTSDDVYELFGGKIYTGFVEQSTVQIKLELLLLQNFLYKMREAKNNPMYAERQIKWINVFLADDVIILAPDELYASCLKENKMLPKNYINEKQWQKRLKEFMAEEVFY